MISPGKGNEKPSVKPSTEPKTTEPKTTEPRSTTSQSSVRKRRAMPANSSAILTIKQSLKARVLEKLREKKKPIKHLFQQLFASNNVVSRPTRFTKGLVKFLDSVGYLRCGTVHATCFLVSEDMVVTNYHVVDKILKARTSSTPDDHSKIHVYFRYEVQDFPANGYELKELPFQENIFGRKLDYAFLHLKHRVKMETLGQLVSCNVPMRGKVCIVGHPNGKEKQEEMCAIIPLDEKTRNCEIERRFRESVFNCLTNQSSCALAYIGQTCAHSYQSALQEICNEEKTLTYDVGSMFEGASGAPVFDMKCNIVALHTGGFRVQETSIVEYGITFEAIIRHLKETGYLEFVRRHFPSRSDEDMAMRSLLIGGY